MSSRTNDTHRTSTWVPHSKGVSSKVSKVLSSINLDPKDRKWSDDEKKILELIQSSFEEIPKFAVGLPNQKSNGVHHYKNTTEPYKAEDPSLIACEQLKDTKFFDAYDRAVAKASTATVKFVCDTQMNHAYGQQNIPWALWSLSRAAFRCKSPTDTLTNVDVNSSIWMVPGSSHDERTGNYWQRVKDQALSEFTDLIKCTEPDVPSIDRSYAQFMPSLLFKAIDMSTNNLKPPDTARNPNHATKSLLSLAMGWQEAHKADRSVATADLKDLVIDSGTVDAGTGDDTGSLRDWGDSQTLINI